VGGLNHVSFPFLFRPRIPGVPAYISDPEDAEYACPPGCWESVDEKGIEKYLSRDDPRSKFCQ